MTTYITRFMMDIGGLLFGREPADVAKARSRAKYTRPASVAFAVGCGLGAACEAVSSLGSPALPRALRGSRLQ